MNSSRLWKKVELLGDTAIIRVPFEYRQEEMQAYVEDVMRRTGAKSVWGRLPETHSLFRTQTYMHLAGEKRSEVIIKENGLNFFFDFTKVFYSSKLSYEHLRVARQVRKGERIINMFSGFGAYSIASAVIGKAHTVFSVDINPWAYYYQHCNVGLNRAGAVIPILGDIFKKADDLPQVDRVISPLPERYRDAYEVARNKVRPGGIIHLFIEVEGRGDPLEEARREFPRTIFSRVVRSAGPRKYHVILDIQA